MTVAASLLAANQAAVEYAVMTAGRAFESARQFLTLVADFCTEHWGVIAVGLVVLAVFAVFRNMSSPDAS